MRDQIAALIGLQFTLFRHTLSKGKAVSVAVVALLLTFLGLACVGIGIALFVFTSQLPARASSAVFVASAIGAGIFSFIWLFSLFIELQRSEVIDFRKMLYLPISLRMVFLLNFATALFSPTLIMFVLPMTGLVLGLCVSRGAYMLLAVPVAAAFYLMLASWAYYVRGLLSALMENKRRRRLIITIISVVFVLVGQLPNFLNIVVFHHGRTPSIVSNLEKNQFGSPVPGASMNEAKMRVICAVVPIGWLPLGLTYLDEGRWFRFLACLGGLTSLMALGLGLGFRSTWRYYTGVQRKRKRKDAKPEPAPVGKRKRGCIDWSLPFLDDETSAMTMAAFLTYMRQPNIYMMILMPVVFGVIFLVSVSRANGPSGRFVPILATIWPMFNFGFILLNVFGIDREGFRTLVLLPTERWKYLLGKNLALMPLVTGISSAFVLMMAFVLRPGLAYVILGIVQVFQLYLLYCVAGNFMSIYFPYRMAWEGLRNMSNRSITFMATLISLGLVLVLSIPPVVFMSLDGLAHFLWGYNGVSIGLPASLLFFGVTVLFYRKSLESAGSLLFVREQAVLDKLIRDRE